MCLQKTLTHKNLDYFIIIQLVLCGDLSKLKKNITKESKHVTLCDSYLL